MVDRNRNPNRSPVSFVGLRLRLGLRERGSRPMGTKIENQVPSLPGITNLAYVEGLYEDYLRDQQSVPPDWQRYFSQQANGERQSPRNRFGPSFRPASLFNPPSSAGSRTIGHLGHPDEAAFQDR